MEKVKTVTELKTYIENFEAGVAGWMDGLSDRLERVENDLAIVKEHLVTRMREDEGRRVPDARTLGPATLSSAGTAEVVEQGSGLRG